MEIVPEELRRDKWEDLSSECVDYMVEQDIVNAVSLTDAVHPYIEKWWSAKLTSVLDAPCGLGRYFPVLKDLGFRKYRGIDISPAMIVKARELHPRLKKYAKVGDVFSLPFQDGEFGLVHTINLMMHLEHWDDALWELWRVGTHMHFDIYVADVSYQCHGVWCDTLRFTAGPGIVTQVVENLPGLEWFEMITVREVQLDDHSGYHVLYRLRKE